MICASLDQSAGSSSSQNLKCGWIRLERNTCPLEVFLKVRCIAAENSVECAHVNKEAGPAVLEKPPIQEHVLAHLALVTLFEPL
jgi:hypothetical protein